MTIYTTFLDLKKGKSQRFQSEGISISMWFEREKFYVRAWDHEKNTCLAHEICYSVKIARKIFSSLVEKLKEKTPEQPGNLELGGSGRMFLKGRKKVVS